MKYKHLLILLIVSIVLGGSCKTLMNYANILKCEFRMKSITNTSLAGVNIQNLKSFSDLNFMQAGKLTSAYLSGNVPLNFQLMIDGENPNPSSATMAQFDWILLIDDIQMVTGTNEQEYVLPSNGIKAIPLNISMNLLDVLNSESKNSLLNFAFNLADAGNRPTRVDLKIKPTIYVGGIPITYPGFIDVGTEFGSSE